MKSNRRNIVLVLALFLSACGKSSPSEAPAVVPAVEPTQDLLATATANIASRPGLTTLESIVPGHYEFVSFEEKLVIRDIQSGQEVQARYVHRARRIGEIRVGDRVLVREDAGVGISFQSPSMAVALPMEFDTRSYSFSGFSRYEFYQPSFSRVSPHTRTVAQWTSVGDLNRAHDLFSVFNTAYGRSVGHGAYYTGSLRGFNELSGAFVGWVEASQGRGSIKFSVMFGVSPTQYVVVEANYVSLGRGSSRTSRR